MAWDYIIVGAGSAGCVLANRLSENPSVRVLLLEAGGPENRLMYKIPSLALSAMNNPISDWRFKNEPDPTRNGKVDLMCRGKVLGGSSAINGTFYVRGNRGDYDHWNQLGNRGWSYDELLDCFRRVEGNRDGVSSTYGTSGPVVVSEIRGAPKLSHVFVDAMAELGYPRNPSYNAEPTEGAAILHVTQHKGFRWSAARGFLEPIMNRPNLKVETGANVRRIIFEGRVAKSIEYERDGHRTTADADGEIIVSASAFNSPKLLMLSGVGPAEDLNAFGIPVVHDSPGVGQNLQEHPNTQVKAEVNVHTVNLDDNMLGRLRHGLRFIFTRGGPATYSYSAIALIRTRPELEYPDVQFHFAAFASEYTPSGIRLLEEPGVTLQPNVNNSRSRGYVKLRSSDPHDDPLIYPNMLSDQFDVQTLIAAGRIARKALATKAFTPFVVGEIAPGKDVQTDNEWEGYIRQTSSGSYHPCGTCKMGIDRMAVVDPELKVRGVDRLRVIDSSIMPQIPSCNLNAISMAIGQKGSELLLAPAKR